MVHSAAPSPPPSPASCVSPGENVSELASSLCETPETSGKTCGTPARTADSVDELRTTATPIAAATSTATAKTATANGRPSARRRNLVFCDTSPPGQIAATDPWLGPPKQKARRC